MTELLLKHKVLIFFVSMILVLLFWLIAFMMPDSGKIPSKGVFVLGNGHHLQSYRNL